MRLNRFFSIFHQKIILFMSTVLITFSICLTKKLFGYNGFLSTFGPNALIIITTCVVVLLTGVVILIIYIKKINKMKQMLINSNVQLSRLNKGLVESNDVLKQQIKELITEQRSLFDSEKRYSLLFEKMMNGFFVFRPIFDLNKKLCDLLIISANPSIEFHTNRRTEFMVGKTWKEIFGETFQQMNQLEKVWLTGTAQRFETYISADESYYLVNAFRIQNNQLGVVIDNITEYKNAIEEVGTLNERLELRVAEQTKDLQVVIQELEAFVYTVSHDLKSPIRAVDGYSKIILEDYEQDLPEEVIEMLSMIRSTSLEMIDMIAKLLQYSTTSRMSLLFVPVDLKDLLISVFHEVKITYPGRNIELNIETGLPEVLGDSILLKQALHNMISNAMKFTKDREFATITVGATLNQNEYTFYIKDNGVGFNMKYSHKLFNIFQRLHSSEEFEGSGIGLVTIKKIIEKHNGRTWIEAKLNIGTTIYFTLPVKWKKDINSGGDCIV